MLTGGNGRRLKHHWRMRGFCSCCERTRCRV